MWKFHWHHTDDEGKELTTTQTSVPIGEPVPLPPDVAANTLTAVTLEPEESTDPLDQPDASADALLASLDKAAGVGSEPLPEPVAADVAAGPTP
jgi:hypothetical protein